MTQYEHVTNRRHGSTGGHFDLWRYAILYSAYMYELSDQLLYKSLEPSHRLTKSLVLRKQLSLVTHISLYCKSVMHTGEEINLEVLL
jgi:hypothetical protein